MATASISGTIVTVTAVAPGIATVTVTASDPEGLQGQARFAVTVPNRPPVAQGNLEPVTVPVGASVTIDVTSYLSEPDGRTLTYSAASSDPRVATVTANQQIIIVSSLAPGTADITVTATLTVTARDPEPIQRRPWPCSSSSGACR